MKNISYNNVKLREDGTTIYYYPSIPDDMYKLSIAFHKNDLWKQNYDKIKNKKHIYEKEFLLPICYTIENEPLEHFLVITLNDRFLPISSKVICKGNEDTADINIGTILSEAVSHDSHKIVVSHNHPSGNVINSFPDDNLTEALKEKCESYNIELVDHIIVGKENGYYSYSDNNFEFDSFNRLFEGCKKINPNLTMDTYKQILHNVYYRQ